ncbi:MAG TPA: hypothetical protein VI461_00205, partial [Chitinophagaceae bacterium]|nr:hypothetical protein [Chitinophagaceae bacterium]
MLKTVTSLSFLYALTIVLLVVYGLWYYRDFVRSALQRRRFPIVFSIIGAACFAFLWINIHAPLKLETFSNTDHHFIRHDGFVVNRNIELGKSDTVNFSKNSYNSFILKKKNQQVTVTSRYSEDPFYTGGGGEFKLLSSSFAADGHTVSFKCNAIPVTIRAIDNNGLELSVNSETFQATKQIKKGITIWNVFKDDGSFINSSYYNDGNLTASLRNIFLLRNRVSGDETGELHYFISGRIFQSAKEISYDQKKLQLKDLHFLAVIPDKNIFAWGIGFFDGNRNQFRLQDAGNDSFYVMNRYPVSYPLTEENNRDWSQHSVRKFLLSDSKDILNMASVFKEGFLFSALDKDSTADFFPVLLTYNKDASDKTLQLKAQWLNNTSSAININ